MVHRLPARILVAPLFALLTTACNADLSQTQIPFSCGSDMRCPTGFRCAASYCVPEDVTEIPTRIDLSASVFRPILQPDPDRGGVMGCWTTVEAEGSATSGIDGVFFDGSGQVTGPIRLDQWDGTGGTFRASCAPIPNSQGAVLIAYWFQKLGVTYMRLDVWTPTMPGGHEGTARLYYQEYDPSLSALLVNNEAPMTLAVVGNQVWVPFQAPYARQGFSGGFPPFRVIRLRVGSDELASGRPARDDNFAANMGYAGDVADAEFQASTAGDETWFIFGRLNRVFEKYPLVSPTAQRPPAFLPLAEEGFGTYMGARGDTIALVVGDPYDPAVLGLNFRIAYFTLGQLHGTLSSRLPFTRLDTEYPAGMLIDDRLYFVGSRSGPAVTNVPLDAGAADAMSGVDAAADGDEGGVISPGLDAGADINSVLSLWSTGWQDSDPAEIRLEHTYPRYLGNNPIIAASARPLPGGHKFALAWVEYFPADAVGHGVRYVGYAHSFDF